MSEILMNKEQIMEVIPHRDPFLLIDEILEMEVGVKIKARKYLVLSSMEDKRDQQKACLN